MLETLEQGEGEIAFEMALVELIEDDGVDALERGIGDEAAGEDAFGHEAQAGVGAGALFEADLVPDGFADDFAKLRGDPARGHAGGDAARFEDEDLA